MPATVADRLRGAVVTVAAGATIVALVGVAVVTHSHNHGLSPVPLMAPAPDLPVVVTVTADKVVVGRGQRAGFTVSGLEPGPDVTVALTTLGPGNARQTGACVTGGTDHCRGCLTFAASGRYVVTARAGEAAATVDQLVGSATSTTTLRVLPALVGPGRRPIFVAHVSTSPAGFPVAGVVGISAQSVGSLVCAGRVDPRTGNATCQGQVSQQSPYVPVVGTFFPDHPAYVGRSQGHAQIRHGAAPTAPRDVVATSVDQTLGLVTWDWPASAGSSPVSRFDVTATPAGDVHVQVAYQKGNEQLYALVTGMRAGTTYTFAVTAANPEAAGSAVPSNPLPWGGP